MGCYCCGCADAIEKGRVDAASALITAEANEILREAKRLEGKLQDIVEKPAREFTVDAWNRKEYAKYFDAVKDVKVKREQEKRPTVFAPMFRPHYEAAVSEAQTFYSSQPDPHQHPDPSWWAIVCILAINSSNLYELRQDLNQLQTRFYLHQNSVQVIKKQLEATGSLKPQESDEVDKEAKVVMDRLTENVKQVEALASECAQLLRLFYVEVDAETVKKAEEAEKAALEAAKRAKDAVLSEAKNTQSLSQEQRSQGFKASNSL